MPCAAIMASSGREIAPQISTSTRSSTSRKARLAASSSVISAMWPSVSSGVSVSTMRTRPAVSKTGETYPFHSAIASRIVRHLARVRPWHFATVSVITPGICNRQCKNAAKVTKRL
jgi:hypothetical protein